MIVLFSSSSCSFYKVKEYRNDLPADQTKISKTGPITKSETLSFRKKLENKEYKFQEEFLNDI